MSTTDCVSLDALPGGSDPPQTTTSQAGVATSQGAFPEIQVGMLIGGRKVCSIVQQTDSTLKYRDDTGEIHYLIDWGPFGEITKGMVLDGNKVEEIVQIDKGYIVFLDDKQQIHYQVEFDDSQLSSESRDVIRQVESLAALPVQHLELDQKRAYREVLAHALIAGLNDEAGTAAKILKEADDYGKARSLETGRRWYFTACSVVLIIFQATWVIEVILIWLSSKAGVLLEGTGFPGPLAAGAVGAYLSVVSRLSTRSLDPRAGKMAHYIDGASRILVGAISGYIALLAVHSKVTVGASLPVVGDASVIDQLATLIAIVAGASERLVPDLIVSFEKKKET